MRVVLGVFTAVLILIAFVGIGMGLAIMSEASKQPHAGMLAAFAVAAVPFLIGTVALGSVSIVFAVEQSRIAQTNVQRETLALGEEQLRRAIPTDDPVLAARRARKEAEHRARVAAVQSSHELEKSE